MVLSLIADGGSTQLNRLGQTISGIGNQVQQNRLINLQREREQGILDQERAEKLATKQGEFNRRSVVELSNTPPELVPQFLQQKRAEAEQSGFNTSDFDDFISRSQTPEGLQGVLEENNRDLLTLQGLGEVSAPKDTQTASQRDFAFAQQNGFQGTFEEFLGKKTPSTNINVNNGNPLPFEIPSGFMLKDPSDASAGITPIPGGPKDNVSSEGAAKAQMLRTAEEAATNVSSLLFNGDGSVNWKNIANAQLGTPKSEGRDLRNQMEFGIQAITRLETGAAMPPAEVDNTRQRFQPSVFDTQETVELKLRMFNEFINGTLKLLDPSGRFDDDRFNAEVERRKDELSPSRLPPGMTDNGDGTFTLEDGTVVERDQ